jgi:hypothetical protein
VGFVVRFCTFNAWKENIMHPRETHPILTPAHAIDDPCDTWAGIGDILRRDERYARALDQQAALQDFCDAYDDQRFATTYTRFGG